MWAPCVVTKLLVIDVYRSYYIIVYSSNVNIHMLSSEGVFLPLHCLGNTADNNLLVGQERTYLFITERSSESRRVAFFIHCQHYLVHHIRILVICYGRVWAKSHRITSQGTFHNSKKSVRDNSSLSCDHNAYCWTWSAHWKFGLKELEKWRNQRGEKNMIQSDWHTCKSSHNHSTFSTCYCIASLTITQTSTNGN